MKNIFGSNPLIIRLLNLTSGPTAVGEGIHTLSQPPGDVMPEFRLEDLSQPMATSLHGSLGALTGGMLGLFAYYIVIRLCYERFRNWKFKNALNNLESWIENNNFPKDEILLEFISDSLLPYARDNSYLRHNPLALSVLFTILRKLEAETLAHYLEDQPHLLYLVLQDDELSEILTNDKDGAKRILLEAAQHNSNINTILKESEKFGTVDPVVRSIFLPSAMVFPFFFDLRLFLGLGSGVLLGGLLGTLFLPGIGTAIGSLIGASIGGSAAGIYPGVSLYLRRKLIKNETLKKWDQLVRGDWSEPRTWSRESKYDIHSYVRLFMGLSWGAALGGAWGSVFPIVGTVVGAIVGGLIGLGAAVLSPYVFALGRLILRKIKKEDTTPSEKTEETSLLRKEVKENPLNDVPWYGRMFTGNVTGMAVGGSIFAFIGFLGGTVIFPGVGSVAGAAAMGALGIALGGSVGTFIVWIAPAISSLFHTIKLGFLSDPTDLPLWARFFTGSLNGMMIGMAIGTLIGSVVPGVGTLAGGIVGSFIGVIAGNVIVMGPPIARMIYRGLKHFFSSDPPYKPEEKEAEIPWHIRVFAGAASGKVLGGGIGFIIGTIVAPGAGSLIGAAIGILVGATVGLITPHAVKAYHYIKERVGVKSVKEVEEIQELYDFGLSKSCTSTISEVSFDTAHADKGGWKNKENKTEFQRTLHHIFFSSPDKKTDHQKSDSPSSGKGIKP